MPNVSDSIVSPTRWKNLLLKQKDALLCIFDQGIVSIAGFSTSVLIGRCAPEELGVYYIAWTLVYFIRGFQEQMISVPYTIFHHRQEQEEELAAYRGSCLIHLSGLVTVSFLFLVGLMIGTNLGWLEASMASPLTVLVFLMPALLMREVIRQYCFAHQANISVLTIDFAITVLQLSSLIALGYFGLLTGANAWAVIGVACLVTLAIWYFLSGPMISFKRNRLRADWDQNWGFGKWAVAGQLVGSLPSYLLPWILASAVGTASTGFFAAAATLTGVANIFNVGMANFLTPRAAKVYVEEGRHGLRRVAIRASLVFLVVIGSFVALLAIFGEQIAVKLYGDEYAGLQAAITVMGLATLCESFSIVASSGLFVMEKIKANFWIDVVLMVVTLTVALLLIIPFGLMGAIWTTLVTGFTGASLRFILLFIYLNRETESNRSVTNG